MKQSKTPSALKWIWEVAGSAKQWPVWQTLVRVSQSCVVILYARALGGVIDAAASGDRAAFARAFILFALYNISSVLLHLLNRYLNEKSKNELGKNFRLRAFSQLLHRDYERVSRVHSGEWMTRITSDADIVSNAVSQIIPELIGATVRVAGAFLALLELVPHLTYFLVPGGLLFIGMSFIFRKRIKAHHKAVQKVEGKTRSFMQERLYSLMVIHAFTQETATEVTAGQQTDQLNAARMRRQRFVLFCSGILGCGMVSAQLLGIGLCGIGILQGTVTYGAMSTVLYLVNLLEAPLNTVSGYVSQCYAMLASAERLMEIETYSADMPRPPVPQEEIGRYYRERFASFGLENADFAYEGDEGPQVLQNFSLHIRKGEFVALTGDSGCGKSTTMKVMLNLYPLHGGGVYLRDTDGEQQVLDASWRGLFAYVPQGNQLISGTVRETVAFFDPALMEREEKIYQALRIACADAFVKELPEGLDTVLGERGSGLSEGQMQRLSVARAILSERPILLLDESTSALDAATEEQLLKNLRGMTDRTVLIITHRKETQAFCDKRIHFENPSVQ